MTHKRITNVHPASLALTMSVIVCLGAAAQMDSYQLVVSSRSSHTFVKSSDKQIVSRVLGNFSRAAKQLQQQPAAKINTPLKIAPSVQLASLEIAWRCDSARLTPITTEPHLINLPPPAC